jgi:hypothetical protein
VHTNPKRIPFSTREEVRIFTLACLFDSLVRVSRRVEAPHFQSVNKRVNREGKANRKRGTHLKPGENNQTQSCNCEPQESRSVLRIMQEGLVMTKMEALPLSLSRLQVLCHSLSKVLFKLSLTLLVCYRSSYFMFNFGRQIPAD